MKKKTFWIVTSILSVIIIALVWFVYSCSSTAKTESLKTTKQKEELANQNIGLQNSHFKDSVSIDCWKKKYNDCAGVAEPPVKEQIEALKAQIAKIKQPVTQKTSVKRKVKLVKQKDVTETKFQAVLFAAPVVKVSSSMTQVSDNTASNAQYKAVFKGAVGVTISPKRNPIYYVKGSDAIKAAPYWCGDSNKKMSYDTETGYWFYADLNRILSDQELSDPNFYLLWNLLTGTVNWGGGSYQTWLPHEYIKPLLNSVRGFEYGFITNDDLNQMSQKDSRIWSPSNPSGIYQPLKTEVHERTDANYWQGWNFRTKVNFTRIIN